MRRQRRTAGSARRFGVKNGITTKRVWFSTEGKSYGKQRLQSGNRSILATNDYLVSANGLYFVIMQSDGNLVISARATILPTRGPSCGTVAWLQGQVSTLSSCRAMAIWSSTKGSDPAHQGAFVRNSGKAPGAGVYGATMQNDGNLVVTTGNHGPVECAAAVAKLKSTGPPYGRPSEPDPCG